MQTKYNEKELIEILKKSLKKSPKGEIEISSASFQKMTKKNQDSAWYVCNEYYCTAGMPCYTEYEKERFLANSTHKVILSETDEYCFSIQREVDRGYPNRNFWGLQLTPAFLVFENKKTKQEIRSISGDFGVKETVFFNQVKRSYFDMKEKTKHKSITQFFIDNGYYLKILIFDKKSSEKAKKTIDKFSSTFSFDNDYEFYEEKFNYCAVVLFDSSSNSEKNLYFYTNCNDAYEVLLEITYYLNAYNLDEFTDVLNNLKSEYGMDMNQVDFAKEERLHYLVTGKVVPKIEDVFGKVDTFRDLVQEYQL